MDESYDAIIIGAGIIGCCVAYELAKRGKRTLNIDKLPASGYGSTSGSCAIIRTHYSTVDGCALAYEGVFVWRKWAQYIGVEDERGLADYHNTGCVALRTETNEFLKPMCERLDIIGIPWEDWDREKISERLPFFDLRRFAPAKRLDDDGFGQPAGGAVDGAVFFPDAGYVSDPQLATHNVQCAVEAVGGKFRFNAEVAEIRREENRVTGVVLADGKHINAPIVVNVAGPHSARINGMAGVLGDMNIETKALRQEVAHVPSPAGFDFEHSGFIITDSDVANYCRPEVGNHILIGSEDPECDAREWVDPDNYNRDFTDQWTTQVHRQAQRIPTLPIPSRMQGVVDLYDVSDDWIPIYDRSSLDGFYMAIGTSGNQFKNAPVAGAIMAELILACEGGHDHDAEPVQFELPHIGRTIDIGFYSRRREINMNSSFSVLG
jgi:sarcosine oxidase subunit beta